MSKKNDPLLSALQTAERMTAAECATFYHENVGRGLDRESADLMQFVCQRLGVKVEWSWYDFVEQEWHMGRREE